MLLGADDAAVLVHEELLFGKTRGAVGFVSGAVKHLGARTAQQLVLLAVNVIKPVGRTRVISHDWIDVDCVIVFYSLTEEKKESDKRHNKTFN